MTERSNRKALEKAADRSAETTQYITFKAGGYLLALPGQRILRVVKTPPPDQGGLVSMGMVQLAQYSIQIIDIAKLLNLKSDSSSAERSNDAAPSENPPFLVVFKDREMLWGIAVNEAPDLLDIPRYALRPVPPEKRLTPTLRWISHVVTYDLRGNQYSLLLLDLEVVFSAQQAKRKHQNTRQVATSHDSAPHTKVEPQTLRKSEMYA